MTRPCGVGMALTLTLPVICPEPGCGAWLQPRVDRSEGVEPHYRFCHPGAAVPEVTR